MASKAVRRAVVAMDRCDLCGAGSDGTFSDRTRHLRKEHPAYARGLLLRIVSPLVFLAAIVALQAARAPAWTAFVATAAGVGLALVGIVKVRGARSLSGAGSAASLGKILSEGGLRFVLLAGVFVVMLVLAANR